MFLFASSKISSNIDESSEYVLFVFKAGELVTSTVERYNSCLTLSSLPYPLTIFSAIFTRSPVDLSTICDSTSTPTVGSLDGVNFIFSLNKKFS